MGEGLTLVVGLTMFRGLNMIWLIWKDVRKLLQRAESF